MSASSFYKSVVYRSNKRLLNGGEEGERLKENWRQRRGSGDVLNDSRVLD
jgi:hypothetical protein